MGAGVQSHSFPVGGMFVLICSFARSAYTVTTGVGVVIDLVAQQIPSPPVGRILPIKQLKASKRRLEGHNCAYWGPRPKPSAGPHENEDSAGADRAPSGRYLQRRHEPFCSKPRASTRTARKLAQPWKINQLNVKSC